MTDALKQAVARLTETHQLFAKGELSSVAHGDQRETALAAALIALAATHGVTLEGPLHIDSRGEFRLVACPADGSPAKLGGGRYGAEFAAILNQHHPRCGVLPTAVLDSASNWCYMNHFEVERMVVEQALGS